MAGAKHKKKAAEKEAKASTPVVAAAAVSAEKPGKKEKKEKTPRKKHVDANGNELKKPLSAYMLFNNYRRPALRQEHQGKSR